MNFDALAPVYRPMETLLAGRLLQRARTAFLSEAAPCRKALLLGEGPGRFLAELLRAHPHIAVTCVEQSRAMIHRARIRLESEALPVAQVRFEAADALAWSPASGEYDLVASHFFLDCFPPDGIRQLVRKVAAFTAPDARWLLADFRIPDAGWRRLRARAIHRLMYLFFRVATGLAADRLTPPDPFLRDAGFRLAGRRHFSHGLLHSDSWRK